MFLGSEFKNEPHRSSKSILSEDQLRVKVRAYSQPFEALQETQVSAGAGESVKIDLKVFSREKIKNRDSWTYTYQDLKQQKPVFGVDQNL